MKVEKIPEEGSLRLKIGGRLTAVNAGGFGKAVEEALAETDNLVLDFVGASYVSSAALRVIISAQKRLAFRSGSLVLCNISGEVLEIFHETGMYKILDIRLRETNP
jgi:anti-sigma B factor antagonist